jgi:hypothetical protein
MMPCLLEEMRTNQEKMDANLKEIREDIKTNQDKADIKKEETKAKTNSHHKKLMTIVRAGKEKIEAMREVCLEKVEAFLESKDPASLEV